VNWLGPQAGCRKVRKAQQAKDESPAAQPRKRMGQTATKLLKDLGAEPHPERARQDSNL